MRKSRKLIAILATLALLATLLVPMVTPAAAGTTYEPLSAPLVSDADNQQLGTLYVKIAPLTENSSAILSLPKNFVINVYTVSKNVYGDDATVTKISGNELRLDINPPPGVVVDKGEVTIKFDDVDVPTGFSGDVNLKITNIKGQLPDSDGVVIARVGAGEVLLSAVDIPSMGEAGATVEIDVKETNSAALKKGDNSLKLKLPAGFTWKMVDNGGTGTDSDQPDGKGDIKDVATGKIVKTGEAAPNVYYTVSGRDLVVYCGEDNVKKLYRIIAKVEPTPSAKYGDVNVSVSGESNATPTTFQVAKYGDYGVKVSVEKAPELLAGRIGQKIGTIVIEENIDKSLVAGRTVTMTLPEGARWAEVPKPIAEGGVGIDGDIEAVGSDGRIVKFKISQQVDDNEPGKLTFKNVKVDLAVDFNGDLEVEFGGSAGAGENTVAVAKVIAPVTASASAKKEVKIGLTGQPAGDITIVEAKKEALIYGKELKVVVSSDISYSGTPTVEVIEGDLEIDKKSVKVSGNELSFKIKSESTTPSTIKISNIKYKVNRTVVEGDLSVSIKGAAVDQANNHELDTDDRPLYKDFDSTKGLFPDNTTAAKVVNATVVTPAPEEQHVTVVFTVNDTKYTVNGIEKEMDVAPYNKNDRVFIPVRYTAEALGVLQGNILYGDGKVTLIKGEKIVQLTIGSNVMLINGTPITMDVAPEIADPGRTMLPFRWVARAFSISDDNVKWDQANQTVTLEI